jgi:Ca-activated chloride channel family protein
VWGRLAAIAVVLAAVFFREGLAQEPGAVVFKSAVERVAVAVIVRDGRGRLVTNLQAKDFELFDNGMPRPLLGVWSEPSPASVAILMDASGSMATKLGRARETAAMLTTGLKPGADEVALYAFDTGLKQVRPFSTHVTSTHGAWNSTRAFGATSLWDAIAATAQQIADRRRRRALVVITDGVDSASRLKPAEVSAIASSLDVPVYMLVITFAADGIPQGLDPARGPLADLASWTGGESLVVRDVESMVSATAQVLAELHHQYVIAFEPSTATGWHPLVLRTRKPGLFVRARSGYTVK